MDNPHLKIQRDPRAPRPLTGEAFRYRSGRLFCEGVSLSSAAERFGTPTYVYSQATLLGNFRRLSEYLADLPSLICYSVKANSNLKILRLLRQAGAGFDVVSGGELLRVLRAGAKPDGIVFSGVGKTAQEMDAGIRAGILMFNIESGGELELIQRRARALGKKARVAIRINPDVRAETHPYVATGRVVHKFGVPREDARALYRQAAGSRHLEVRGVACHIGSQILEVEPFLQALDEVLRVAEGLRAEGVEVEDLDLGGGYAIRYADEPSFDFSRLVRGIAERLRGTPYRLILEPGRALVGEAGILLTRVLYVKRSQQKNFVVVDAGMNDLMRPALYGSYHEIVPLEQRSGEKMRADVVGPLCETGDFLAHDREMAVPREGDLLALMSAGAYGYVLASNYNSRPRPAELLVHGQRVELIRRRERLEDLLAGEDGLSAPSAPRRAANIMGQAALRGPKAEQRASARRSSARRLRPGDKTA
jgi:diaminopimelate decarboxylase